MRRILMGLAALSLLALPASAADLGYGAAGADAGAGYVGTPYQSGFHRLPVCDEPHVVKKAIKQVTHYDTHVILAGLGVQQIDGISETSVDLGGPGLVPRRYCHGTVQLASGARSEIVYLIEFQGGFASVHWSVETCLPGYDPYRVYGAWCHAVRP